MVPRTELIDLLAIAVVVLLMVRLSLPVFYRRGRQVEYRIGRGSGTGVALGISWLRLRVRSLSSGHEYTVPLTRVRRR
jgi:hypothetical protein